MDRVSVVDAPYAIFTISFKTIHDLQDVIIKVFAQESGTDPINTSK